MTGSDLGGVGMKAAISGTANNTQKQKDELIKKTEAELAEAQKQLDELEWEQNQKVIENKIELTKEQKLMLEMSEADIQNGRTIDYKNN